MTDLCRICRRAHAADAPHMLTDTVQATPAAVELMERIAALEDIIVPGRGEPVHRVKPPKGVRNDYMRGYMRDWRANRKKQEVAPGETEVEK